MKSIFSFKILDNFLSTRRGFEFSFFTPWNNYNYLSYVAYGEQHLTPYGIYNLHFKDIPHAFTLYEVNAGEMSRCILKKYDNDILKQYKVDKYYADTKESVNMSITVFKTGEMMDVGVDEIVFYYRKETLFTKQILQTMSDQFPKKPKEIK